MELSGLVAAARLASAQAQHLEALDQEVLQLQKLLTAVGHHVREGRLEQEAQQPEETLTVGMVVFRGAALYS